MISQISQINPYTLIIPPINSGKGLPKAKVYRSFREQERADSAKILDILCLSPNGIFVKALQKFIAISEAEISHPDITIKKLTEKGTIELIKDKYRIADKDFQKVMYRKLGSGKRANRHNLYGHALAEVYRYQNDKFPETASHFWKAGNMPQAKEYLEKAGDHQKEIYKNNDAIRNYKRCISLLSEDEGSKKLDVMIKMLEIMYTTGKWDEFNAMYEEAELIAKKMGDKESRAKVLNLHGSVCFFRGEVDKAIKTFRRAESLMLDNINSYTYAETMRFLGRSFLQMGKNDKAEDFFNKTLRIGEKLENDELRAKALENIGRVYRLKSEYEKAVGYYKQALPLYKRVGNISNVSRTLEKIGVSSFYSGNNKEALKYFKFCIKINIESEDLLSLCNIFGNVSTIKINQKKYKQAFYYSKKQLHYALMLKNLTLTARAQGNLGLIHLHKKEYSRALSFFSKQLKVYKYLNIPHSVSNTLSNIGLVLAELRHFKKAVASLKEQLGIDIKINNLDGIVRGYSNLGKIYFDMKDLDKAEFYYSKAYDLFESKSTYQYSGTILYNYCECCIEKRKIRKAITLFNKLENQLSKRLYKVEDIRHFLSLKNKIKIIK